MHQLALLVQVAVVVLIGVQRKFGRKVLARLERQGKVIQAETVIKYMPYSFAVVQAVVAVLERLAKQED
jgi:hypothetical protein